MNPSAPKKPRLLCPNKNEEEEDTAWKRNFPKTFLDTSTTISIAPFGSRRLPELKDLYQAVMTNKDSNTTTTTLLRNFDDVLQSGGRCTSDRHLRRRTTSFQSRKRHRYPAGKPSEGNDKSATKDNNKNKLENRKSKRKKSSLCAKHSMWQRNNATIEQEGNDKEGVTTTNWITTHIWHTKRFYMSSNSLFGWKIPMRNVSRGPIAVERLIMHENRTTVQDISWSRAQPIVLITKINNFESSIKNCLKRLCPTFSFPVESQLLGVGEKSSFHDILLYKPDCFPCKVIGPAKVWLRRRRLAVQDDNKSNSSKVGDEIVELYLFVHPSIRQQVYESLQKVVHNLKELIHQVDGAMSCFQLRGKSTECFLEQALQLQHGTTNFFNNKAQVISVTLDAVKSIIKMKRSASDEKQQLLPSLKRPLKWKPYEIMLVRNDPQFLSDGSPLTNNKNCHDGWDLYCAPSDANDIFMRLVKHPHAVSIGCVEAFHLSQDVRHANFPWAYPDSKQGRVYWEDNNKKNGKTQSNSWSEFRIAVENSNERKKKKLVKVQTKNLLRELQKIAIIKEEDDDDEGSFDSNTEKREDYDKIELVVVRGSFGQPFNNILQLCAHLPLTPSSYNKKTDRRRRPRRRKRLTGQNIILACPKSKEDIIKRKVEVTSMQSSLALPALIQCQLKIYGRGSFKQGYDIYACELTDVHDKTQKNSNTNVSWNHRLGIVMQDAYFNTCIGQIQGNGFIGASRLLKFLGSCQNPAMMVENSVLKLIVVAVSDVKKESTSFCRGVLSLIL